MELRRALDLWRVGEPRALRRADAGLNNLSHFVDAPEGRYFLRRYRDGTDFGRIRYEHALLARLQSADLYFAVPRPLETESKETIVVVDGAIFALFPEIRGLHPERGNVRQVESAGAALGQLDEALAEIELPPNPPARPMFGDLCNISPLLQDPPGMVKSLPVCDDEKKRLRALFERVEGIIPALYERLPRQIIHSDLSYGNVLMVGERVSGILDFEFAAPDLRALDFTVGLELLCLSEREAGARWTLVEAFSRGYGERVKPVREEIEALPELLLLRGAAAFVHRVGRMRAEPTGEKAIADRCRDVLSLEAWLSAYGEELVRRVGDATL